MFSRRAMLKGSAVLSLGLVFPTEATGAAQFDQTQVELVWEAAGSEEVPLLAPDGMALAADGTIHVANARRSQIVVLSPDGEFVEAWGGPGSGPGQFSFSDTYGSLLGDLDFDAEGNLYVFDVFNFRVQKFSPDREFILEITGEGTPDGPFVDNVGGCVDAAGARLFVTDFSDQVRVFDLEGNFLWKFGSNGVEDGQFFWPFGVALASDGSIYVSEIKGKRVQKFDSEGNFLGRVVEGGAEPGQVGDAYYVVVDGDDNLFISDTINERIQIHGADGAFVGVIDEVPGFGVFGIPAGLAVDANGHIYVSDNFKHRVLKLKLPPLA
jgi:DNA-binding beta-propeller fold protein YncE